MKYKGKIKLLTFSTVIIKIIVKKEGIFMKFTIKRELLLEGLNKVSKAISTKNLIPVLAGIKFDLKMQDLL